MNSDLGRRLLHQEFDMSSLDVTALTQAQREILRKYGSWLKGLAEGLFSPTTPAQRQFLAVVCGERRAETLHEIAWVKYLEIRARDRKEREKSIRDLMVRKALSVQQLTLLVETSHDFRFSPEERKLLEEQLADARAKVAQPWRTQAVYSTTNGQ